MSTAPAIAPLLFGLILAAGPVGLSAQTAGAGAREPVRMLRIPSGLYAPFTRDPKDAAQVRVSAFLMDELPVTNARFLDFVRANPKWRRSEVGSLFADSSYLADWDGDLVPGSKAPPDSPVVHVSWFAARAFARWEGKRLPTTDEWEYAASAGYSRVDGWNDQKLRADLYAWFARPSPPVLPSVDTAKANYFGVRGLQGFVWEWVEDFNTSLVTGESRADSSVDADLFGAGGAVGSRDTGDYAAYMRTALRSSLKANNTTSSLGFRCVRDTADTASDP